MPTVHFVCYGNICRSPFAEHYARKIADARGLTGWSFTSTGVGASPGAGTPKPGLAAAKSLDVDLTRHAACHVEDRAPAAEDLVLAMDRYVFGQLAEHLGPTLSQVRGPNGSTLRLMMQEVPDTQPADLDVPDPMGQGLAAYERSYDVLRVAVDNLVLRLLRDSNP